MAGYILLRFAQSALVIIALVSVVFVLQRTTGSPADLFLPPSATAEEREEITQVMGLDKSVPEQYFVFVERLAQGDLGTSLRTNRPVQDMIAERLPNSAKLAAAALAMSLLISFPLGIAAAVYKGSIIDHVALLIASTGQAMPTFWLGIILIQIFAVRLQILPIAGMGGIDTYILPAASLGWFITAGLMRLLRSNLIEALESDYVRYATIKGLHRSRIILTHALRNALIPVVTLAGVYIAALITGAVIVETIFAWPGIGRMAFDSIAHRDFPVTQGIVIVAASFTLMANLAVDIGYGFLDPRIRPG